MTRAEGDSEDQVEVIRRLPSTAQADIGPIVHFEAGRVTVGYDHDHEPEEAVGWTELEFDGVAAYRFTDGSAPEPLMFKAYSKLVVVSRSPWLADLDGRASHDSRERLWPGLRHFMIYFDHHGCVEVLGTGVTVKSERRRAAYVDSGGATVVTAWTRAAETWVGGALVGVSEELDGTPVIVVRDRDGGEVTVRFEGALAYEVVAAIGETIGSVGGRTDHPWTVEIAHAVGEPAAGLTCFSLATASGRSLVRVVARAAVIGQSEAFSR